MFEVKKPVLAANYYPEAWERKEIDFDLDLMVEMGINCVRIAEFAWSTMEPKEGEFDFSLFREVVDKCLARGIAVVMGTPTACPPRWLTEAHPEVFMQAINGKLAHGGRRDCCSNNETYLKYCDRIVEKMAKEFARDENIIGWQIDNEIEPQNHGGRGCVCPTCEKKYREFLEKQFGGYIDKLNREWGYFVFSQNLDGFGQLHSPTPVVWEHPSNRYWWSRFQNETYLAFIRRQYDILKKYVSVPVGHDSMPIINLDYNILGQDMDVMQYNHYDFGGTDDKNGNFKLGDSTFWYDFLRPMKDRKFWITETSCCWNGGTIANYMRPYGFNEVNVWLGVLKGAEYTGYWLWRSHYGGQELMHGACVTSSGRPSHVAAEIKRLSAEFDKYGELMNGTDVVRSDIGIHLSCKSFDMITGQRLVPDFGFDSLRDDFYMPLRRAQYNPDVLAPFVNPDGYKLIFTPYFLNLDEENTGSRMLEWVNNGGVWIVGPFTDIRNASAAKFTDRVLGVLENIADATQLYYLPKGESYRLKYGKTERDFTSLIYDVYKTGESAKSVVTYSSGEYTKGLSAVTETSYGKGKIVLLGVIPDSELILWLTEKYAKELNIAAPVKASPSVVTVMRKGEAGEVFGAVEVEHAPAYAVCPFDGTDVIGGKKYHKNDKIELAPYGVSVVVKD